MWYSIWHDGNSLRGDTGDVGCYPSAVLNAFIAAMVKDPTLYGVMPASTLIGGFTCSGATSPVTLSSGLAVVNGRLVLSTTNTAVDVATPAVDTRYDLMVLRYTAATHEVRPFVIQGVEGTPAYPTQTNNATYWDIPLWQIIIQTTGAIALTSALYNLGFTDIIDDDNIVDGTISHAKLDARIKADFAPFPGAFNVTTGLPVSAADPNGCLFLATDQTVAIARWSVPVEMLQTAGLTVTPQVILTSLGTGGNIYGQLIAQWGKVGEPPAQHSVATGMIQWPVSTAAGLQVALDGPIIDILNDHLEPGDIVEFYFERDGTQADDDHDNDFYGSGVLLEFLVNS